MKKYIVEYKTIAYFEVEVEADSEQDAERIASELDMNDFSFSSTLSGSWEFSQTINGERE